jgi:hypothetical protein
MDAVPTPLGTVVGRHLFYNDSAFDQHDPQPTGADNLAIAPDKQALLPGQTATFANYSSYDKGINGILIDFTELTHTPTAADFTFTVGNDDHSFGATWHRAPDPLKIAQIPTPFGGTLRRVAIVWPNAAITNEWLQVLIGHPAGPAAFDQFAFGNAIGESGNDPKNAIVDTADEAAARLDPHNFRKPAAIDNAHDYNRDKRVDATDQLIARSHATTADTALRLINLEPSPFDGPLVAVLPNPTSSPEHIKHRHRRVLH